LLLHLAADADHRVLPRGARVRTRAEPDGTPLSAARGRRRAGDRRLRPPTDGAARRRVRVGHPMPPTLVDVDAVSKSFWIPDEPRHTIREHIMAGFTPRPRRLLPVLDSVSLQLRKGEALGVMG